MSGFRLLSHRSSLQVRGPTCLDADLDVVAVPCDDPRRSPGARTDSALERRTAQRERCRQQKVVADSRDTDVRAADAVDLAARRAGADRTVPTLASELPGNGASASAQRGVRGRSVSACPRDASPEEWVSVLVRIEEQHRFSTPVEEAFRYITDPSNWPDYWPGLVRIEPGGRWQEPGDRTALVLRLLGRQVRLEMTLTRYEPPHFVGYRTVQAGLPDARHERIFSEADGGFDYRLAIEYEPRPGLHGLFDRVLVRRALARALRKTIQNLETALRENRSAGGVADPHAP